MIAQTAPTIQWQKSVGGSRDDYANSVQQTADGGYIIGGYSPEIDYDYWVVKFDSSGTVQWQKSFGGSDVDIVNSIRQTTDGGYIVAGYSNSNDGDVSGHHGTTNNYDYWVVKLDSSGAIQWQKSLGGTDSERADSVQQTADGGYIVAGYSASTDGDVSGHHGNIGYPDYWIVKLDSIGTIQWEKSLGGSGSDIAYSIQQTTDGGYIVSGFNASIDGDVTGHHGNINDTDYWIVKLDNSGAIQWQKSLGGSNSEYPYSIQQTTDGGYIVAGSSDSSDGDVSGHHGTTDNNDFWVVKLDSAGVIQWQKSLGGNSNEYAFSVHQTTDGGYIVAGSSYSTDGDVSGHHGTEYNFDYWVVKLSSSGNIQWEKALGGSNSDSALSIQQTTDGGYVVVGFSSSTDGDVGGNHGSSDLWIVKLSEEGLATQEGQTIKINIYPNPVKDILNFSEEVSNVIITDVSGKLVKKVPISTKSLKVSNLTKGHYIITATTKSGQTATKKMIKE